MKLGVIMDPVEGLDPARDTTVGMLLAAQKLGWSAVFFTGEDLWLCDGEARGRGRAIRLDLRAAPWFELGEAQESPLSDLDAILLRKDPPVDEAYIHLCQLLEFVPGGRVFNRPAGVLAANEKIFAQKFKALQPPTLISADMERIRAFVDGCGDAVIKPLNGMQGQSVFRLSAGDANGDALVETMTARGRRFVVVQALIPEYAQGDLRVLMLDGEPVSPGLLRVPPPGKLRANMAAGGRAETAELDGRILEMCAVIGPALRDMGLLFVGLDFIGGRLTEINVTSPTGMRQIDAGAQRSVGERVMCCIEGKVRAGGAR